LSAVRAAGVRVAPLSFAREAALGGALFLASSGTVQQYLGLGGVVAYAAGVAVAVPLATRVALPWLDNHVSGRTAAVLLVATWLVLLVAFVVVYPHANRHGVAVGSDRDDAATIATKHLLHGLYPYSTETYLGNPVSQLPGALFLDAPFVLFGNSAYENPFWLAVLLGLLVWIARDARIALAAAWIALLLSPALLREYLTGGDVLANTVAVLVFGLGCLLLGRRWRIASAVLLGVALSWRPNLAYWLPLFGAAWARRHGAREAVVLPCLALAAFAAVTLPFYLTHLHDFTPLQTANKVRRYDDVLPKSSVVVLVTTGLGACWAAWHILKARIPDLLGSAAAVQAILLGWIVVLASASEHRIDFSSLVIAYGLFFLLPVIVGTSAVLGPRGAELSSEPLASPPVP
jgi:hypothetical protein